MCMAAARRAGRVATPSSAPAPTPPRGKTFTAPSGNGKSFSCSYLYLHEIDGKQDRAKAAKRRAAGTRSVIKELDRQYPAMLHVSADLLEGVEEAPAEPFHDQQGRLHLGRVEGVSSGVWERSHSRRC